MDAMSDPDVSTDEALRMLGRYSKWQVRSYCVFAFGFGVPLAWMLMAIVFIGDTPGHRCALPANVTLNETIPMTVDKNGDVTYSKCEMYSLNSTDKNDTTPCTHGYWYDPESGYDSTLVTEWDLVCDRDGLVEVSMTVAWCGCCLGILICSRLSDVIGRKPVFLFCLWTNALIASIQALSPNFYVYAGLGFLDGLQQQGLLGAATCLVMELFPTEQRTFAGMAIEFFWAFGYIILVPIAYSLRNWRTLQLVITLPIIGTISFYWLISESIPWLVARGQYKRANEVMRKAARVNQMDIPHEVFKESTILTEVKGEVDEVDVVKDSPQKLGVLDIFRSTPLRWYSIIIAFLWFVNALGYFAITFTVTYLPGDRYVNFLLYSLTELPAYAIAWIAVHFVGRRLSLIAFHLVCGVALILTFLQAMECCSDITALTVLLNIIGKTAITSSFATVYLMTPEIYPTSIRNVGLGMCQLASRFGTFLGPYSRILARHIPWATPVIIGILSLLAGFLTFFMPETGLTPLPETVEDVKAMTKAWRKKPASSEGQKYEAVTS